MTKKEDSIYLDYSAATPIDGAVLKKVEEVSRLDYGNPHSVHQKGEEAKKLLMRARKDIARAIGAREGEVIFTSGGTESNNTAILGVARYAKRNISCPHIITSKIEHDSVRQPVGQLEKEGCSVGVIPVNEKGIVDIGAFEKSITPDTVLVSFMHVSNELGTIQPVRDVVRIIKKYRKKNKSIYPYLHVDSAQAARYIPFSVHNLGVDLLSLDSIKMYGPKGSGILFVRSGTKILPLMWGGGESGAFRPGTENVPGCVGMAHAFASVREKMETENKRLAKLKEEFVTELLKDVPEALINGTLDVAVPGILNVSFPGVPALSMLLALDVAGIYVSTGSACASTKNEYSEVVRVATGDQKRAESSIRFSFGINTKKGDLERTISTIRHVYEREMKKDA